jgi:hypothetical protein
MLIAVAAGCQSPSWRRVARYENRVSQLERQLEDAKRLGLCPSSIVIPPNLRREIRSLKVYRPLGATLVAIFPGVLLPGLGSAVMGRSNEACELMGEAYTGVFETVFGLGFMVVGLAMLEAEPEDGEDEKDSEEDDDKDAGFAFDLIFRGMTFAITGPARYLGAWGTDIAETYASNEELAEKVRQLRRRYRRFVADYAQYCEAYTRQTSSESLEKDSAESVAPETCFKPGF